jgi:hypothetical protein
MTEERRPHMAYLLRVWQAAEPCLYTDNQEVQK